METKKVNISTIKEGKNNPRFIRDEKYDKLLSSIENLQEMLKIRPVVIADGEIIGGNMRFRAAKELGLKSIEAIDVSDWSKEKRQEFMIKDNMNYGKWDYDKLANEWNSEELNNWGVDVWQPEEDEDIDLDAIDGMEDVFEEMEENVVSALQIKFEDEDFEEAKRLYTEWNKEKKYVGGELIKQLKIAKEELL